MMVKIGDKVKLDMGCESILNGKVYEVTDVIRSVFDKTEVLAVEVNINGTDCQMLPECCTVVA